MAVAFDTLKAATRLQNEAGFNEKQARVLVATLAEGIGENLATKEDVAMLRSDMAVLRSDMATKEDLAVLRSEMATKEDLAVLRGKMATKEDLAILRGEMCELEQRMTIRLGAMIAAAVGIIVALDKLL